MSGAEIVPFRADEVAPAVSLGDLAAAANAEHEQVVLYARQTLDHALKAGGYLLTVFDQIPAGEWEAWVKANLDFGVKVAATYQRIAFYKDQLGPNITTVTMAREWIRGLPRIRPAGPASPYSDRMKDEVRTLRDAGLNLKAVSLRTGVPLGTIQYWEASPEAIKRKRRGELVRGSRLRQEAALRALEKQDRSRRESAEQAGGELGRSYLELHAAATLLDSAIIDRPEMEALTQSRQFILKAEELLASVIEREAAQANQPEPVDVGPSDREKIYSFARSAAWKIPHHRIPPSIDRDDLIQAAVIAALDRVKDYDPEQGTLTTFLWARINGAIEDEIRNNQWPKRNVKIADKPEIVELDRDTYQIANALSVDDDDLRLVAEQLRHLPSKERLIVTLHSFCGITLHDLAPVYGVTPSRMTQFWQEGVRQLQSLISRDT